ncbi:MAG: polyprenyl synthetase family protein [Treponema sp.]|jgi:octaprenyl-diphosphate synthase|nr:polyprenyl synthetase family protein [Treponema sp.]
MDQQYIRRLEKIEAVLDTWLPQHPGSPWMDRVFAALPGAVSAELVQSLTRPGRDLVSRGGKRWRPLLMTLICESLGGGEAALPLVPLVECSHNASLIHDDIEDNSDERRGKPAVHLLYGTDAAINGGCFLYFLPLVCIDFWGEGLSAALAPEVLAERKNRIYALWGEYMRKLHLGQAMDIHWHRDFTSLPGLEEYHTMCRLKTGCLARFAAVLGVNAAAAVSQAECFPGGETELAERLGRAAENFGVGFQILDDVKNLTTGIPGKKRGDDVVEGKKSLPVLLHLHRRPERRDFAARCFAAARTGGTGAPEVEALIGELAAAGVLEEAEEQGRSLIGKAREEFAAAGYAQSGEAPDLLAGLTELLSLRGKLRNRDYGNAGS